MATSRERREWHRAVCRWGRELDKAAYKQYRDERVEEFKAKRKKE